MYKYVLKKEFHRDRKMRGLENGYDKDQDPRRNKSSAIDWSNIEDVIYFENTCSDQTQNVYIFEPPDGLKIHVWKNEQAIRTRIDSFVTLITKIEVEEITVEELEGLTYIDCKLRSENDLYKRKQLCEERLKAIKNIKSRVEKDKLQIIERELKQEEEIDWIFLRNQMTNKIQKEIITERLCELKEWQQQYMALIYREKQVIGKHDESLINGILRRGYLSMATEFMKRKFENEFGKPFVVVNHGPIKAKMPPYEHMRPCQVALITLECRRKFLMLGHLGKLELLPMIDEARDLERFARMPINQSLTGLEDTQLKYKLDNLHILKPKGSRALEGFKVFYDLKFDRQILLELINQCRTGNNACNMLCKGATVNETKQCYPDRSSFGLWMKTKAQKPNVLRVSNNEIYVPNTTRNGRYKRGFITMQQSVCGLQREQTSTISKLSSMPINNWVSTTKPEYMTSGSVPSKSASLESVFDEHGLKRRSTLRVQRIPKGSIELEDVVYYLNTNTKSEGSGRNETKSKCTRSGVTTGLNVIQDAKIDQASQKNLCVLNKRINSEQKPKKLEQRKREEICRKSLRDADTATNTECTDTITAVHWKNVSFEIAFERQKISAKPCLSSAGIINKNTIGDEQTKPIDEPLESNNFDSSGVQSDTNIYTVQDIRDKDDVKIHGQSKIALSDGQSNISEQNTTGKLYNVQKDKYEKPFDEKIYPSVVGNASYKKQLLHRYSGIQNLKHLRTTSSTSPEKENSAQYSHNSILYGQLRFRFSLLHATSKIPCKIPIWKATADSSRISYQSPRDTLGVQLSEKVNIRCQTYPKSRIPAKIKGIELKTASAPEAVRSTLKSKIPVRVVSDLHTDATANAKIYNTRVDEPKLQRYTEKSKAMSKSKIPIRMHGFVWNTRDKQKFDDRQKINEVRRMLAPLSKIPIAKERLKHYKAIKGLGLPAMSLSQFRTICPSAAVGKDAMPAPILQPIRTETLDTYCRSNSVTSSRSFTRFSPLPPIGSMNAKHNGCGFIDSRSPKYSQPFSRISPLSPIGINKHGTLNIDRPGTATRSLSRYSPLPPIGRTRK